MNITKSALVLILLWAFVDASGFQRATFKASYVQEGEKVMKVKLSTDVESVGEIADPDGFQISPTDSLACQVAFIDDKNAPISITQPFIRFENLRTGKDNLFLLKKKGRDMKVDIKMDREVKSDLNFWNEQDFYLVELIMGDLDLHLAKTWTITEKMAFSTNSHQLFKAPERNVFDFDVSVKKSLLPEFTFPIAPPEKRAHPAVTVLAVSAILLSFALLLFGWTKMGVLQLSLKGRKNMSVIFGFELCVIGHAIALCMFWLRWDIILTWKVTGVLMVPTWILGQKLILERKET